MEQRLSEFSLDFPLPGKEESLDTLLGSGPALLELAVALICVMSQDLVPTAKHLIVNMDSLCSQGD